MAVPETDLLTKIDNLKVIIQEISKILLHLPTSMAQKSCINHSLMMEHKPIVLHRAVMHKFDFLNDFLHQHYLQNL